MKEQGCIQLLDLSLSLVQMQSVVGDPDTNFKRTSDYIKKLSSSSDIICFPEASLTGYTSETPERYSLSLNDERILRIRELAEDNKTTVVFGLIEKDMNRYHITQAIAGEDGTFGRYRKTHLGRGERVMFTPGNEITTFRTPKVTLGIQLCWESHFPEISTQHRKCGAELILMPYGSPLTGARRKDVWMRHVPARAADNCVFVGVVNAAGDGSVGNVFGGGTMAFDPKGKMMGEYFGTGENILTVDLQSKGKNILGSDDNMGAIDYFLYRREDLY